MLVEEPQMKQLRIKTRLIDVCRVQESTQSSSMRPSFSCRSGYPPVLLPALDYHVDRM